MYRAPLKDLSFVLNTLLGAQPLADCPAHAEYSADLADSILSESARFAEGVLEPINRSGDEEGAHWSEQGVHSAKGFREAYRQFIAGGWPQLRAPAEIGGQGMPLILATAVQETWASANLAFKLCPMLTYGAIHALEITAAPELKQRYLPKMVTGEWTGTMVLTEPQAGSDLALIRTRAVPQGGDLAVDEFRLFGQKIFITWGEHDLTENIVHMVLARIDGAPEGVRGISLFLVPKFIVHENGELGPRNDLRCVSIEHKLGIHASPTCVMAFGEREGATGYLVGQANRGLEYMFIMMNAARLAVGLQGYAVAERAFQQAADYARGRLQGRSSGAKGAAPIIQHPDVKRMLLEMKSGTEAMRALTLYAAWQLDLAESHSDPAVRKQAQARGDLLIPIVKGWSTEFGIELASTGIQVHGGTGFIEETGAAQWLRDVRITSIYEGTTGIQANDLLGRKLLRDKGVVMMQLLAQIEAEIGAASGSNAVCYEALSGVRLLREATGKLLELGAADVDKALAVAVPYLMLCGFVLGGWLMARAAKLVSTDPAPADREFSASKRASARAYVEQLLPRALGYARMVTNGSASIAGVDAALI
ncbi:MAG TPA: acyl-CoA dehydrogenase [Steroidobacteraceae bacterium]|jgi:3-(methylthio)propanoyl-CoA dehydrogenase|nr:acyl-CoA dehydrogenase [Steroidobacteraceae bacterium]